ncbi:MAG: Pvc16 family protein, partial [Pseudonocardiaceae bacterium]
LGGFVAMATAPLTSPGLEFPVFFDAPTKDKFQLAGATPKVDIYLYAMYEDPTRRSTGQVIAREPSAGGTVPHVSKTAPVSRSTPPRYLKLSYMITVWMGNVADTHTVLGLIFSELAQHPVFEIAPVLEGSGEDRTIYLEVGEPPAQDRILTDLWSTFQNTLVPLLNVTVTVPMRTYPDEVIKHYVQQDKVLIGSTPHPLPDGVAARDEAVEKGASRG